ncbi:MAG: hypothetical protein NC349_01420 [Paenibacillus sp.]|nr:hypothetical protein [Paenibacillus sp.]
MKRHIFILLCVLITSLCAYSQDEISLTLDDSQDMTMQTSETISVVQMHRESAFNEIATRTFDYKNTQEWRIYKVLRAVGWSSLGVGIPTTFYGLVGLGLSLNDGGNGHPFIAIIATGGALTLSSIPLLIIANKYKRKAKKIALNVGVTSINSPSIYNRIDYAPAISFALNF